jgi:hypothetical protein
MFLSGRISFTVSEFKKSYMKLENMFRQPNELRIDVAVRAYAGARFNELIIRNICSISCQFWWFYGFTINVIYKSSYLNLGVGFFPAG